MWLIVTMARNTCKNWSKAVCDQMWLIVTTYDHGQNHMQKPVKNQLWLIVTLARNTCKNGSKTVCDQMWLIVTKCDHGQKHFQKLVKNRLIQNVTNCDQMWPWPVTQTRQKHRSWTHVIWLWPNVTMARNTFRNCSKAVANCDQMWQWPETHAETVINQFMTECD